MSVLSVLTLTSALLLADGPEAQVDGDPASTPGETGRTAIAAGVWTSPDGSKVTYESSYFEAYQAVTAADLLRWVPGGAELLPSGPGGRGRDKRGFGSGGDQVLINGKRLSGKSNDIASAMQRIQADAVARVEVIRGTAAGLDVRSEGTLINVVLNPDAAGGAGSWQLHSGFYGQDQPEYDGLVSWSDSVGSMSYLVSAQYGPYNRGNDVDRFDEYFAAGSDELTERREIEVPMLNREKVLNGSTSWSFSNGALLNLNARIADRGEEQTETTRVFSSSDPDVTTLEERSLEEGLDWEFGGDFEQRLGPGTLQTRAIYTNKEEDDTQRISQTSTDSGNVPAQSQVDTASLATEAILRGSYSWPLTGNQNLELGLEGARNTLEKDVALFEVLPDGSLVPVDIFNADSDVNEDRFEFFSTHFWNLREDLVLESALNIEYSRIAQEGIDVANARSFTYLKPRFDLRWDLSDSDQLRASLERTVSQLNFGDFVANFDSDDDQVAAGNPDLEPEKTWEYKLTFERRLPEDSGVLSAQLFYDDIQDHIDNVRVADNVSAAGNIGDAERYGLTLKGSLRLESVGLAGAVLDASYTVRDSETTDPFVGTTRKMSGVRDQEYSINFRHDIAQWRFNYSIEVDWNGDQRDNDITYRQISTSVGPRAHVSMQYRLTDRIVLWFDTRIVFDGQSRRVRDLYVDDVADNILLRTEVRNQFFRREHILGLRGQF